MGRKIHKPEEIVGKLRQVDVLTAQGTQVEEAVRSIGVTGVTYSMPNDEIKPKELLANKELLGFARLFRSADQIVQRASSAKVTAKSALREELVQVVPSRPPPSSGDSGH